jgi:hypothetical protein
MLRQFRSKWVINPGSVGMPFREAVHGRAPTILPFAEYATITDRGGCVSVALHRIPLSAAALHAQAGEAPDNPITPDLQRAYA